MIPMTLGEIAAVVSGRLQGVDPGTTVPGPVHYDSRAVTPGSLFLALPGDHVDGHDYARSAVAAGAVAVIGTRAVDAPAVVVGDGIAALTALAAESARRLSATV